MTCMAGEGDAVNVVGDSCMHMREDGGGIDVAALEGEDGGLGCCGHGG